ncbi:MAG TPA: DUF3568 family protein [Deltaproteobacteria bacterium]|nr:DUF3568 family protein [Deltaproteobacteria bacterium]
MRKLAISLILLSVTAVNTGCVGIFAAGVVTGAGHYIKYSMDCVASRTFMGDLQYVTSASIDVLKEMKIKIDTVERHEEGAQIFAETKNLRIRVTLDPISDNTTKVSIDVSKYTVLKDKATASAIISRINIFLTETDRSLAKRNI